MTDKIKMNFNSYDNSTQNIITEGKELELLITENIQLKRKLKSYQCQEKFPGECHCAYKCLGNEFCYDAEQQLDRLKAENKHINDLLNQALKELEKTRETLTEIKEIAEEKANINDWLALEILQKISECEENDDL